MLEINKKQRDYLCSLGVNGVSHWNRFCHDTVLLTLFKAWTQSYLITGWFSCSTNIEPIITVMCSRAPVWKCTCTQRVLAMFVCAGAGVWKAECAATESWIREAEWRSGGNGTEQRKNTTAGAHAGGQVDFFNMPLFCVCSRAFEWEMSHGRVYWFHVYVSRYRVLESRLEETVQQTMKIKEEKISSLEKKVEESNTMKATLLSELATVRTCTEIL